MFSFAYRNYKITNWQTISAFDDKMENFLEAVLNFRNPG